ncbi:MAG: GntR family transcriptional regulator, partial [Archangium sp.]|nr:GntR family transcriptional regulator [Archangium sp.]
MSSWPATFHVEPGPKPQFLRIAEAVTAEIRRGRLRAGARLPGSRVLARMLGVHRNTVLAALAELEAQGWVTAVRATGTFVAESIPEPAAAPPSEPATRLGFRLPPAPLLRTEFDAFPRGMLALAGGSPDARHF